MKAMNGCLAVMALLLVLGWGMLGGCQQELFSGANNTSFEKTKGRFYDNDSAVEATESRRKSSEMGFGYPSGMLQQ